ncbi:FAD-binding oxidoreductase [Reyranella sp.]|uniref:FAD-binding oxidoreductase n=1 Tax=Reyranella sp. TaxID=1929291 RepID=UPI003D0F1B95
MSIAALRGGGGNFGVVTAFEYQLHPVSQVLGGMVLYPLEQAAAVLRFYRDFCPTLPDEAEAYAALLTSPEGMPVAALLLGYSGPIDGKGPRACPSVRYATRRSRSTHGLLCSPVDARRPDCRARSPSLLAIGLHRASSLILFYLHGTGAHVPATETAFSARRAQWDFHAIGQWAEGAQSAKHIGWVRNTWSRVESHLKGSVYINHVAADDLPEKVRASFGDNYQRLRQLKAKFDPGNLFRVNANIPPG